MYNHFIDNQRRFARLRLRSVAEDALPGGSVEALPGGHDPVRDAERVATAKRIEQALAILSDEHRLVVLLHDVEGYKLAEIQDLTGDPVGTIKSRLHRARARLREILDADGTDSSP
jgi:RNA polymerase sigma-70 factor (ECF subfamily)